MNLPLSLCKKLLPSVSNLMLMLSRIMRINEQLFFINPPISSSQDFTRLCHLLSEMKSPVLLNKQSI